MPTKKSPPSVDEYPPLAEWLYENARCLWQDFGKSRTVECWQANGRAFLVVVYAGGGWDVYTSACMGRVDETLADLERRLGMRPQVEKES